MRHTPGMWDPCEIHPPESGYLHPTCTKPADYMGNLWAICCSIKFPLTKSMDDGAWKDAEKVFFLLTSLTSLAVTFGSANLKSSGCGSLTLRVGTDSSSEDFMETCVSNTSSLPNNIRNIFIHIYRNIMLHKIAQVSRAMVLCDDRISIASHWACSIQIRDATPRVFFLHVRLNHIESYWIILNHIEPYWTILNLVTKKQTLPPSSHHISAYRYMFWSLVPRSVRAFAGRSLNEGL